MSSDIPSPTDTTDRPMSVKEMIARANRKTSNASAGSRESEMTDKTPQRRIVLKNSSFQSTNSRNSKSSEGSGEAILQVNRLTLKTSARNTNRSDGSATSSEGPPSTIGDGETPSTVGPRTRSGAPRRRARARGMTSLTSSFSSESGDEAAVRLVRERQRARQVAAVLQEPPKDDDGSTT